MELAALLFASFAYPLPAAQDPSQGSTPELDFQTGSVAVGSGLAEIDLPDGWTWLGARDARWVVESAWGNPPSPNVLGMAWPPSAAGDEGMDLASWAVIVTFDSDGHVDDSDAADIDYEELLSQMRSDDRADNRTRRERGYPTVELLGWAEPPHYDPAGKRLYWAKRLRFEGTPEPTLNYNVRLLGRDGVLVMNAVASNEELAPVSAGCKGLVAGARFVPGKRYEDYRQGIDPVAAYGLGGLIAGKALLKVGFLKGILLMLAKGWKVVALVAIGLLSALRKFFGARRPMEGARAATLAAPSGASGTGEPDGSDGSSDSGGSETP